MAVLYQDRQTVAPFLQTTGVAAGTDAPTSAALEYTPATPSATLAANTVGKSSLYLPNVQPSITPANFQGTNPDGDFVQGLTQGMYTLQGAAYGTVGALGAMAGSELLANYGAKGYEEAMNQAAWNSGSVATIEDISSAGDFLDWATHKVGSAIPMIASTVGTGGLAGATARTGSNIFVRAGLNSYIKKEVGQEAFESATDAAKTKILNDYITSQVGKAARSAGTLQAAATESGLNWAEVATQLENPMDSNPYIAVAIGSIAGGLELLGIDGNLLSRIIKTPMSNAADKTFREGMRGLLNSRLASTVTGAVSEGSTEGAQEILNIINSALQIDGESFATEEMLSQVLNAFAAGAVTGGAISAVLPDGSTKQIEPTGKPQDILMDETIGTEENPTQAIAQEQSSNVPQVSLSNLDQFTGQQPQQSSTDYTSAFLAMAERNKRQPTPQFADATSYALPTGIQDPSTLLEGPNVPDITAYQNQMAELDSQMAQYSEYTTQRLNDLTTAKTELQTQLKREQDINPANAKALEIQLKELDKETLNIYAAKSKMDTAVKKNKKDIQANIDKTMSTLDKEQRALIEKQAKIKSQPRLSDARVMSALIETQEQIAAVRDKRLADINKQIKTLQSDVRKERKANGTTPKLLSLEAKVQEAYNTLNSVYSDSEKLITEMKNMDSDSQLSPFASKFEEFKNKYNPNIKQADPVARVTRAEVEKDTTDAETKAIASEQKSLKLRLSLIEQSSTLNDLDKAIAKAQIQEQLSALELRKTENDYVKALQVNDTILADTEQLSREEQQIVDRFSSSLDYELARDATAIQQAVRAKALRDENFTDYLNDTSVVQSNPTQPEGDIIDATIEELNATTAVNNLESQLAVNQFIENDYPKEYTDQMQQVNKEAIKKDAFLSTMRDDSSNLGVSPAKKQIATAMDSAMKNNRNYQAQGKNQEQSAEDIKQLTDNAYATEVIEATAAERTLRPIKEKFDSKNEMISEFVSKFKAVLKNSNVINPAILDMTTFVYSATDINVPVELQNIVAMNDNVMSAYHNGRIYIFVSPIQKYNLTFNNNTSVYRTAHSELVRTAIQSFGLSNVLSAKRTSRIAMNMRELGYEGSDPVTELLLRVAIADPADVNNKKYSTLLNAALNSVYTNGAAQDIRNAALQSAVNPEMANSTSFFSTVDNTPINIDKTPPMWGLLFGNLNQANIYETNQSEALGGTSTPITEGMIIKYDTTLGNQPALIKKTFTRDWKPTQTISTEADGSYSVRVAADSKGLNSILVKKNPRTNAPFSSKQEALDAIKNNSVLYSLPMPQLLSLMQDTQLSPKQFAKSLRAIGIRGADYDGRITIFSGDDVNLVPYFSDLEYTSSILGSSDRSVYDNKQNSVETIVDESPVISDTTEVLPTPERTNLDSYFSNKLMRTSTPQQAAFLSGVNSILEKMPAVRKDVVIVNDMNDGRVPDDARRAFKGDDTLTGFYDNLTGKVFIFADNVITRNSSLDYSTLQDEGSKTAIHEIVVHLGFGKMLGNKQKTNFFSFLKESINQQPDSPLADAVRRFKEQAPSGLTGVQFAEEFTAWLAESMDLDSSINTPSVMNWYTKALSFIRNVINNIFKFNNSYLTLDDLHNSIKESAYRLTRTDSTTLDYSTRSGKVSSIETTPVESKYVQGAKFDNFKDCLLYTNDVLNSHRFALGLPTRNNSDLQVSKTEVVQLNAPLSDYPNLVKEAQAFRMDTTNMTVKQFIDNMPFQTNEGKQQVLKVAGVKILTDGKNVNISLLTDSTIMYPEDNRTTAISFLESVRSYLEMNSNATNSDVIKAFNDLTQTERLDALPDIRFNARRIKDNNNVTTVDEVIKGLHQDTITSNGKPNTGNPSNKPVIEKITTVQKAKEKAYKLNEKFNRKNADKSINLNSLQVKFKEAILDQYAPLKETEEALKELYGTVEPFGINSVYNLTATVGNKIAIAQQKIDEDYVKPIIDKLTQVEVSGTYKGEGAYVERVLEHCDLFAFASHAKERNASIRAQTKGHDDAGSGITDAQADEILAFYDDPKWSNLKDAVTLIQELNNKVLHDFHDAKMIKEKDYAKIDAAYDRYVPLIEDDVHTRLAPEIALNTGGAGLSVNKKRVVRYAKGRSGYSIPHVFANSIIKAKNSVVAIERNNIGRKLLDTVESTNKFEAANNITGPQSSKESLWEVSTKSLDDDKNTALRLNNRGTLDVYEKSRKHKFEGMGHELITVIDTNGDEVIIAIKDKALGKSLKGTNMTTPSAFIKYMSMGTRQMSRLLTGRNPAFIIVNSLRDIQASIIHASSALTEPELNLMFGTDRANQSKVINRIRTDMAKNYKDRSAWGMVFNYFKASSQKLSSSDVGSVDRFDAKYSTGDTADMWNDFQDFLNFGGKTTISTFLDTEGTFKDLRQQLRKAKNASSKWNLLDKALGYLDAASDSSETAVRFATYRAYYKQARAHIYKLGLDDAAKADMMQQAKELSARMALESTVNFSRRGTQTGMYNTLYAFSSAALQGANRTIKHLWRKDDTNANNYKRVSKYLAGFALAGMFVSELAVQMMGEDEDGIPLYYKIPQYERDGNIIIPSIFMDGGYLKIPLPPGLSSIYSMGVNLHGVKSNVLGIGTASKNMLSSAYSSIMPWNLSSEGLGAVVPTLIRPVYQVYANKTFAGTPIYPESTYVKGGPDSQKFYQTTPEFYKTIAEFLNYATLGDKYSSGLIDISPETIEHIANSYLGGLGRLMTDSYKMYSLVANGEDSIANPRLPVFSGITGVVGESGTSNLYYTLSDKIMQADKKIKDVELDPEATRADVNRVKSENKNYAQLSSTYSTINGKIKKLNEKSNGTLDDGLKDKYRKQIIALQKQLVKVADSKGLTIN